MAETDPPRSQPLHPPRTLRRREVSAAAGVSLMSARRFWRALGMPIAGEQEQAFSAADVDALASVVALVRDELLDEATALPQKGEGHPQTTVRAVGFADLVSFTRLVRRLTERELAAVVQHLHVRVAMATGSVVGRLGDVFGTTVNRASRLTAPARPGAVLVDVATVHSLAQVGDIEVQQLRGRTVRGIGHVVPWVLPRSPVG